MTPERVGIPNSNSIIIQHKKDGTSFVTGPHPILIGLPPVDRLRSIKQYYVGLMLAGPLVPEKWPPKVTIENTLKM